MTFCKPNDDEFTLAVVSCVSAENHPVRLVSLW